MKKIFYIGASLTIFGVCGLFLIGYLSPSSYNIITLFMSIFTAGFALSCNKLYVDYMSCFGDMTGSAAAFGNILRFLFTSVFVSLTGYFFNGSITVVTNMMFFLIAMSVALFMFLISKKAIE